MQNLGVYTSIETYGNSILYRGRLPGGQEVRTKLPYAPTLFVRSKNANTKFKTIHNESVDPIKFGGMKEAREFVKQYENTEGFDIFGMTRFQYCFISDHFRLPIHWNIDDIVVKSLDIETKYDNGFPLPERADQEITAITVRCKNKITSFGCKRYIPKDQKVTYIQCPDEITLLERFLEFWMNDYPDVVTGWNCRFFDIPYIVNRMVRVLGEPRAKLLSPWKMIDASEAIFRGKTKRVYNIKGIATLDYLELFRKYDPKGGAQESYKLDAIARYVLGRGKVKFEGSLKELYETDFPTYMDYNIEDVNLVHDMNEKGRLIELALTLAYQAKVNIDDIFYQTKMWDSLIFNHLRATNRVVPKKEMGDKDEPYDGAVVKPVMVGHHDWTVSFDLTSEYPKTVIQYNISPETLIENPPDELRVLGAKASVDSLLNKELDLSLLEKYNVTMTPNGVFFRKDIRGFLPVLIEEMFNTRSEAKNEMIEAQKALELEKDPGKRKILEYTISKFHNLQLTLKICLNSAYGALGTPSFRYYEVRLAVGITSGGQLAIRWAWKYINEFMNKVLQNVEPKDFIIASDTDSVYIDFGPLMKKLNVQGDTLKLVAFVDKVCKQKFQPMINDMYQKLADYVNAYEQAMEMKREAIADKAIWVAKKNYILHVWNSEGVQYEKAKIKISGLAAVKSAYPMKCREELKEIYKLALEMDQEGIYNRIEQFKIKFKEFSIEQICKPTGVTNLYKFMRGEQKSIPAHVKGALVFNEEIKKHGLDKTVDSIKEGDKIRYLYLKSPNPFKSHVMSFIDRPPKEFGVEEYIDYELQFDKVFLDPVRAVTNAIGLKCERMASLEDMFG